MQKENESKYNEVSVPSYLGSRKGYHLSCYKKFAALPKKYQELAKKDNYPPPDFPVPSEVSVTNVESSCDFAQSGRSSVDTRATSSVIPADLRTGIFPKVRLLCKKATKRIKGSDKRESLTLSSGAEIKTVFCVMLLFSMTNRC